MERTTQKVVLLAIVLLTGCKQATTNTAPVPIGVELCKTAGYSIKRQEDDRPNRVTRISRGRTNCEANDAELLWVIGEVWEVHSCRIDQRVAVPAGWYNITTPGTPYAGYKVTELFALALKEAFGIKLRWEMQEREAYVVRLVAGKRPDTLVPADADSKDNWNSGKFTATTLDQLCDWMEDEIKTTPVVNETGLAGKFNFELPGEVLFDAQTIPQHVRKLGLEVKKVPHSIRMLVVERN